MPSSFIETIARDFDERLMESHHEAMECHDVQDMVGMSTDLATRVHQGINSRTVPPSENASVQGLCRMVLRILTKARTLANECCEKNFETNGLDQLDNAAIQLRETLCALIDAAEGDSPPLPEVTGAARATTVPDSWFEENHSGLRGPFT